MGTDWADQMEEMMEKQEKVAADKKCIEYDKRQIE